MTNAKPAAAPALAEAVPAPPAPAEATPTLLEALRRSGRPLLLTVRKKKRKRYSRGLRELQKDMQNQSKATSRLLSALAAGSEKYEARAKASAEKKRDGALRDHWKNSASAVRTTLRKSSKAIDSRGVRDAVLQAVALAVASGTKKPF